MNFWHSLVGCLCYWEGNDKFMTLPHVFVVYGTMDIVDVGINARARRWRKVTSACYGHRWKKVQGGDGRLTCHMECFLCQWFCRSVVWVFVSSRCLCILPMTWNSWNQLSERRVLKSFCSIWILGEDDGHKLMNVVHLYVDVRWVQYAVVCEYFGVPNGGGAYSVHYRGGRFK